MQAWDFTDSCSRPAAELHATHARITTIEFLASSATSTRAQLLALGDATGTLHVFEVPRSLTRPVPKEEQIMLAFFEREQARGDYVRTMPEIEGFTSSAGAFGALGGASAESKKVDRGSTAPATAGGSAVEAGDVVVADAASDEAAKALKKEEDEFLKAEAAFIAELGLAWEGIPDALRSAHPPPKEDTKK